MVYMGLEADIWGYTEGGGHVASYRVKQGHIGLFWVI